jgi:hypothetical protein
MANGLPEFVEFLQEDEASRKALEDLALEKKGRALDESIVQLAAAAGYTFTVDELEKAFEDGLARLLVDEEIDAEELEDIVAEKQGCFIGWIGIRLFARPRPPLGPLSSPGSMAP